MLKDCLSQQWPSTLLAALACANSFAAESFLEKSSTFEIKKQFDNFDLGLLIGESTSAIDHNRVDSTAVNLESFINLTIACLLKQERLNPNQVIQVII
jgi:hypothetical protein